MAKIFPMTIHLRVVNLFQLTTRRSHFIRVAAGPFPSRRADAECVRPSLLTLLVIGPNGLHRHVRIIRGEAGHAQVHQPIENFGVPLFPRQRLE